MATLSNNSETRDISSTDNRKRLRFTLSNECFLDTMVSIPDAADDITILTETVTPPVLNIDNPFDIVGKTRIYDRDFAIDLMFKTFDAMLYSDLHGSRFMSMVRYLLF